MPASSKDDERFRFCPECGVEAGPDIVCSSCGASLSRVVSDSATKSHQGGALPATEKADADSSPGESLRQTTASSASQKWWVRRRKVVIGVGAAAIGLLLLTGAGVIIRTVISDHNTTSRLKAEADAAKARADAERARVEAEERAAFEFNSRCVELWNGPSNSGIRTVKRLTLNSETKVSIGPSADAPEKCLVTTSSPSTRYPSGEYNMQYLEGDPTGEGLLERYNYAFGFEQVGELDPSNKQWNARYVAGGKLELLASPTSEGAPASATGSDLSSSVSCDADALNRELMNPDRSPGNTGIWNVAGNVSAGSSGLDCQQITSLVVAYYNTKDAQAGIGATVNETGSGGPTGQTWSCIPAEGGANEITCDSGDGRSFSFGATLIDPE